MEVKLEEPNMIVRNAARTKGKPIRKARNKASKALRVQGGLLPETLRVWNLLGSKRPEPSMLRTSNTPYWFKQTSTKSTILTTSNTLVANGVASFTTADVNQFSSFAAVFDQYWIRQVECWIEPADNSAASEISILPRTYTYTVIDYDDVNALTTTAQAEQYSNCVTATTYEGVYLVFQPHMAVNTGGSGQANVPSNWIDCAYTTVPHYGIKMVAEQNGALIPFRLRIRITVGFRNLF
jgi:hypothetical protein